MRGSVTIKNAASSATTQAIDGGGNVVGVVTSQVEAFKSGTGSNSGILGTQYTIQPLPYPKVQSKTSVVK